jgi:flagellar basal-body rod modification protein FlgD
VTILPVSLATAANAGQNAGSSTASATRATGLDRDAFMQLLLAQLRNQDPMKPMEDKEFIGQMAQLNTLEEMQKLNDNLQQLSLMQGLLNGSNLIGRYVRASAADGSIIEGAVTSVSVSNKQVMLQIGGKTVPVSQVLEVRPQA